MGACTAYAYSDTDSTCSLYDLNLNTIRFTKDADSCGFKISRSQNCFDDGKSVTCQGYQNSPGSSASGPNSSNQPSNGSNTGMIIGIVVAVAVIAACVVAVLFYRRKKHSPILVEKQVEHIPPPTDAIPVEQVPQNQYFQATLAPASRTDSKSTAVASNATSSPQQSLQNTLPPVMKPNVESELPILQPGTSFSQANVMQPPVIQGSIQPPVMSSFENTHTQPPIMNLSTSSNKNDSQPPVIVFKESGAAQDSTISAQPPILKDH
ncbi:hypothetical protein HK103_005222 [Boothiomyces macroporosus]|uniref:Uncharacterized protein n=1 Tax=Boothiomyces macroporosus TaxID=261099 RepID=A0AAD5Y7L8_9FUNG|nr:hypothetical protein HK103_005222 [Boothiomyces macroporosus]